MTEQNKQERKLRDLLWATHPCGGKYCDDGEIQCGRFLPPIDFLRDKPEDIETKIPLHNAQLAKALKHRLDRPELREKIESILWHFGQQFKLPRACWAKDEHEYADQILALIPDEEELRDKVDKAMIEIAELNKKLDDREADLIEAKREERERIIGWGNEKCTGHRIETMGIIARRRCPDCWQALKGGSK